MKKVMMFCKRTKICEYAIKMLESCFLREEIIVVDGSPGDPFDEKLCCHEPDYIISFLSPWIIPGSMLDRAGKAAINFHPGSTNYPGIGCYNFAIYERATIYGVVCHHMKESVDTGDIIASSDFRITRNETVESLKLKSMIHLLYLFEMIVATVSLNQELPESDERWLRKPFTRKQLNELCRIDPGTMSQNEISRRIQATTYPKAPGAFIDVHGYPFKYQIPDRNPIV